MLIVSCQPLPPNQSVIPAKRSASRDPYEPKDRALPYYVYMLASQIRGTLYTGVTDNLARRIQEHKTGATDGFTHRYGVKTLVYVETHDDIDIAIAREKRIKRWRRAWKFDLIEKDNPDWRDLFDDLMK